MTSSWCISSSMLMSKSLPTFEFKCIRLKRSAIAASKGHPGTSSLPEVLPLAMAWQKWTVDGPTAGWPHHEPRTNIDQQVSTSSTRTTGASAPLVKQTQRQRALRHLEPCPATCWLSLFSRHKKKTQIVSNRITQTCQSIRYHPYRRIRILSILSFLVLNCFIFWPYTDT